MNNHRAIHRHLKVSFARKPACLLEVLDQPNKEVMLARVESQKSMTEVEYDAFGDQLLAHRDWLADQGGQHGAGCVKVVEVIAPGRRPLYVNAEGYGYARYVGIAAGG